MCAEEKPCVRLGRAGSKWKDLEMIANGKKCSLTGADL